MRADGVVTAVRPWPPSNAQCGSPELNRTYEEMAAHYDAVIIPTPTPQRRDKAKVEAGVPEGSQLGLIDR